MAKKSGKSPQEKLSERPRSEIVKAIRKEFGRTQAELAAAMGTSVKTIQSYEQGWRNVPVRVMIQLFVLLAIYRRRSEDPIPCWEITDCPQERKEKCSSYTMGDGQFCWFVASQMGGSCSDEDPGEEKLLPCMGCAVIARLLRLGPVE